LGLPLPTRPPAVAGSFYPAKPDALRAMVDELVAEAGRRHPTPASLRPASVAGILVPHAGLVYSGIVAAAGWLALLSSPAPSGPPPTIVLLGTNHGAAWLDGVGAWDGGPWRTPLGDVATDPELGAAIVDLGPPFAPDARCHLGEHSLEVQLPFVARLTPEARIVALSVGAGTGTPAIAAGARLGRLLAERRAAGERILLAISSDMAHYPAARVAERVTATLLPPIVELAPERLATAEGALTRDEPGVSCGMCGIEPTVLGLAALGAMGVRPGVALAAATSADAGGDPRRTVGYLAVGFAD
ncbi:MAG TPA: AmmeMemoRadiSam system protein B, partial [Candidatus Nanopelagicales bacterium]|nr:AmmeMemoRadiSam system protein B [Candidatus Nanopelagicales bacterium]